MKTSLARRQRHRRNGAARRPKGAVGPGRAFAIALPVVLFSSLFFVGFLGFTGAVAAYSFFSQGLPDPQNTLEDLDFSQQSIVYDRTGEIVLARLGDDRREPVRFADIPPEMIDATTAIEDKTFWENSGFDPIGFVSAAIDTLQGNDRGGSTITQQLVRNRLLPEDVLAGDLYERKIKEIIQSVRLTEAYPGEDGKRTIMEKYLNNNFYGNRTYGIKAAAKGYFAKDLEDLTLAQFAILAAIPQSPTKFDLVRNAVPEEYTDAEGNPQTRLVVPASSEIVVRRNFILELMKDPERSVLSRQRHTLAEYELAKSEPVVLASQRPDAWRAPQFVNQLRNELGRILCGEEQAATCERIDTEGYRVTSTLDWDMQRVVEKWVYVYARAPQAKNLSSILKTRKINAKNRAYIQQLVGSNIHNAASAVIDYRTGQVRAYAGSAQYTGKGNKKFQPQFDVLALGWRQPGSAIKPLNYLVGIDDGTLTASTMFMDVVTNFAPRGAKAFTPTQADKLERGPVRLRSALQFSLNVPAIKAGILNGLEHQMERTKDFGLVYGPDAVPVISQSIGTLEVHPIDLLGAYGMIANGGVLMPRTSILEIKDADGNVVWPVGEAKPEGTRVASEQAAYIVTDILAGNTDTKVNPYWAKFAIYDGSKYRPAAYKTGTTSDNRDVAAYGYLAPPKSKSAPALAVGVWMGNSNNEPNRGSLSLDSSAPLWSAILTEISRGMPITDFERVKPDGLVTATVDAFTGMKPSGSTTKTVRELFIEGTVPDDSADWATFVEIDDASGLRWQDGCVGPKVTRAYLDFSQAEGNDVWARANVAWAKRAAAGRQRGGPEGTRPIWFYDGSFAPYGKNWGGRFAPSEKCPLAPPPPTPCVETDPASPCPSVPPEESPGNGNGNGNGNGPPGQGG